MSIRFLFQKQSRIFLLLSLCLLIVSPALYAANINVGPGGNLQAVLNGAANGDTITVQAGTYTVLTNDPFFHIDKSITLQASGTVVLQTPSGGYFGLAVRASNVTVRGFTITGGNMGVAVLDGGNVVGGAISNVTLTSLRINSASTGHGIYLYNTSFSTIDSCTVVSAHAAGIVLDQNSNNNLVMNNRVQWTDIQHAVVVKNSNFNTLVNNTITGSAFHGIVLDGAAHNRVEKNSLSGHKWDGIVTTAGDVLPVGENTFRLSLCNYISKNLIASDGLATGRIDGSGISIIQSSDGSYIFGNDVSGAVQGGIFFFNSSNSIIKGNRVHGSGQAGLSLWNSDPAYHRPANNVIHNNIISDNLANANILIRGAWYNNIAFNFLGGTTPPASPAYAGIWTQNITENGHQTGGSTGNLIYQNIFKDLQYPNIIGSDTTATQFFQNRFINFSGNYSLFPADVKWDAGPIIGGNYWAGFPAQGNPSSTTPYTNFTIDLAGNRSSSAGPYLDRYPYQSENLGKQAQIRIQTPVAGQIAAAGSQKTIAWKSKGSVLVDIYYNSAATGRQLIAGNYPDAGFYNWTLPSNLPPGSGYTIQIYGKNSSGVGIGSSAFSGTFTVGSSDLLLLSPGPDLMANASAVIRLAWKKSASVAGVNVFIAHDSGGWTSLVSNVTANFIDVPLPLINSNKVQVMVQSSTGGPPMDAVDGYFTVRGGNPTFTTSNNATGPILIGDVLDLEWISPQNSFFVDLDLWDNSAKQFRSIVANLPDRGKYTWFVPEYWLSGAYVRATFRDVSGQATSSVKLTMAPTNIIPILELLLLGE